MSDPILLSVHGERGPVKDDSLVFTFEVRRDSYDPGEYTFTAEEKLLQRRVKVLVWKLGAQVMSLCDEGGLARPRAGSTRTDHVGTRMVLVFSRVAERFRAINGMLGWALAMVEPWWGVQGRVSCSNFTDASRSSSLWTGYLEATLEEGSREYALVGAWDKHLERLVSDAAPVLAEGQGEHP